MYHGAGFAFGYAPVFTGGTVTMLRAWDPEALLELVERDRVQSVFLVPTHAQHAPRARRPSRRRGTTSRSLDTLYFNAAALPWPLKEWVIEPFPAVGVHELYGSTEGGIITNLRPADAAPQARLGRPPVVPHRGPGRRRRRASRCRPASRASCSAARRT